MHGKCQQTFPPSSEQRILDPEARASLEKLNATGHVRDEALTSLHAHPVRAARFAIGQKRLALAHVRGDDPNDIALQAADTALVGVLDCLDDYRGPVRFTTWASKFAFLEAAAVDRTSAP